MALVVGTNSYLSVEDADALVPLVYDENSEEYKSWQSMDNSQKEVLLLKATALTETLPYLGSRVPGYQSMAWPRYVFGALYDVPDIVKQGIVAYGLKYYVLHNGANAEYTNLHEQGVRTYSVSQASVSFRDDATSGGYNLKNGLYSDIFFTYFNKWCY